jgi:phage replication-related protein YjqB (UPF0714/DUF867 family)
VTRPRIATNPADATDTGHLTELLYDDGENDDCLVCALHGGAVEPGTAEAAVELATRTSATCWALLGYDEDGAFETYHPPSSSITPEQYPLLERIADRGFERVLSLHGLAEDAIVVGGGTDPARKARVRDALAEAVPLPVRTASEGPYGGVNPDNPVNYLAAGDGGVQLELGPPARSTHAGAIEDALADLLDGW